MSLKYNKSNITLARVNRNNQTPEESHLWYDFLSKYEIRFQRQKAIDNFIADFYCHKAKLVVEIDGCQHYTTEGKAGVTQFELVLICIFPRIKRQKFLQYLYITSNF